MSITSTKLNQNLECLGVVLAGGLSTRMGSNKAELIRNRESMLAFSKKQLELSQVSAVVCSGKDYDVADTISNIGPLGGIFSVIEKYHPKALLIMPVDLPLIDHHCLTKLKQVGELSKKACYYQDNFLPLYLPVSAYLENFFNQNLLPLKATATGNSSELKGPSMKSLLKSLPSMVITAERPEQLFNTNTEQEWLQAQQVFSQTSKLTTKNAKQSPKSFTSK